MSHPNLTLHIGIPESWHDLSMGSCCLYRDAETRVTLSVELVESLGLGADAILERQVEGIEDLELDYRMIASASLDTAFGPGAVVIQELRVGGSAVRQILSCSVRDDVAMVATASAPAEHFVELRAYLFGVLKSIDAVSETHELGRTREESSAMPYSAPRAGGPR